MDVLDKTANNSERSASGGYQPPRRIAIIGPGAIGSLLGARLAQTNHILFLLDRNEERASDRNANGIAIAVDSSVKHIDVSCSTDASALEAPAEIVFVCTKTYDTPDVLKALSDLADKRTIAVSMQNGIGNAELIATITPGHTICASSTLGARLDNHGIVHWTGRGPTLVAPFGKTPMQDADCIAQLLSAAGFLCSTHPDANTMLWSKLIINAAINPVTALYGITNGELLNVQAAREQAFAAAREARAVAEAMQIELPVADVTDSVTRVCQQTAENRSSMLQDIEHGRQTEIGAITGAIIAAAREHLIEVPVNKHLFSAIERRCAENKSSS